MEDRFRFLLQAEMYNATRHVSFSNIILEKHYKSQSTSFDDFKLEDSNKHTKIRKAKTFGISLIPVVIIILIIVLVPVLLSNRPIKESK